MITSKQSNLFNNFTCLFEWWNLFLKKMKLLATFLVLGVSVVLVTSHLPRFPRGHNMLHLQQHRSFDGPMWLDSDDDYLGFPNDIRQLMPFSRMNIPPSFPRDWTNNVIPNINNNMGPFFPNNADPWNMYQQLNSDINPITGVTPNLLDGPITTLGGQTNVLATGSNQWNALDSSNQRFPVIPNPARPRGGRGFASRFGTGLPNSGTGLRNTQFTGNGFQSNVNNQMSQNLGLRNNQFQWLK